MQLVTVQLGLKKKVKLVFTGFNVSVSPNRAYFVMLMPSPPAASGTSALEALGADPS